MRQPATDLHGTIARILEQVRGSHGIEPALANPRAAAHDVPKPHDRLAHQPFGRYAISQVLGVGGMATVHRAVEHGGEGSTRTVALKRLSPSLAQHDEFLESFAREAELASLLDHVNIVEFYESGWVGDEYFIAMEYVDGHDVRRILRHAHEAMRQPPIDVTVGLLLQLCDALEYTHTKCDADRSPLGLVHCDVSPSNVLVNQAGCVKLIDFGIAKATRAQPQGRSGRIEGKPAYMSPEAIGAGDLDARSDVFSTGVIAYELVTARSLFAGRTDFLTMNNVKTREILPPSTYNPACPPELDAIVLKALARDPDQRLASASELRDQLMTLCRRCGLASDPRAIQAWIDDELDPYEQIVVSDTGDSALARCADLGLEDLAKLWRASIRPPAS
jgi:eukaryotic-like serine/threonine-protein kinase